MLTQIAIALVIAAGGLAAFVATRPAEFRIARSRTLAAPPSVVHAYVNDFRKWSEWSPFERLDPAMKKEFSGPPAGPGAVYAWSGNAKAGQGRMTILDSRPAQSVTIRLEFFKPWTATNTAQFDFVPDGPGTTVTWAMTGRNNFMAKAFSLAFDMDKMLGADFERGLANLDAATAAPMRQARPGS